MADGDERRGGATMLFAGAPTHVVGTFVAWDPTRGASVTYPGADTAHFAQSIVALDAVTVQAAIANGRGVLLAFDGGRRDAPIVVGLLQEPVPTPVLEAQVDGRKLVLEAADEIVLRCGEASITLRRNGRVVIRGVTVETRATGVNRIRGGSVLIN